MPQQKPTSFIPDSFVPDQKPSSFIPDSFIPDEPKKPDNTLFSRVGEGLSGLKDFASKIIQGANPYTGQLAREEIGEGLVDPFKQLVSSRPNRDLPNTIAENIARFGTGILGFDYNKLDEDIQSGGYSAALGDLVVPSAMLFSGSKLMGKSKPSVKGTSSITELADMIAPDEAFNMPKPQQRLLNAPPQPKLLPAIGETYQAPRFFGGKSGIADVTKHYIIDTAEPAKLRFQDLVLGEEPRGLPTLLPEELGNIVDIGPELAANRTILGKPKDIAQLDPSFAALVPKRLASDLAFEPTNTLNISRDLPKVTQAFKEGGEVVNKPKTSSSTFEPLDIKPEGKSLRDLLAEVSKQTGDSPKVLADAATSKNPIVSKLALDYAKEVDRLGPFSFAGTRLKALGSSGIELYRKGARFAQRERFNLKDWAEPFRNSVIKLSRDEQAQFGNYVEGKLPIPNERVGNVVNLWKDAAEKSGLAAEESGMMIELASGKKVPFKRITENYWPHRLSEKDLANLPTKIDEMIAEGISRTQANRIIENARKYGELILPQQHQRFGTKFAYETHAKSGLIHLESMAKSVARTKEFGRYDLAKGGELGIKDLIEETSNPKRAYDIMKRVIGRDETINKTLDQTVRVARTAVSWARLQNYGLSSIIGNQLPNMLRGTIKEYTKSLGTFIGRNRAITDKSAATINISHGIFEQTRKLNPMKVYGGQFAENIVRGQAAGIGQGLAKTYFKELKKNPSNHLAKKELFELILEDVNKVLEQKNLTSEQLRMAAARNAEISQGLTSPLNMPMFMSEPVSGPGNAMLQLGLIFKKQATIQSKMIKDAMKKDPIKTTAILIGMSQVAGGVIGGIKSATIGATRAIIGGKDVEESISKEYANRANYIGRITGSDNELINRSIDRALQSWALGVGGDLIYLALDENAWSDLVAGPAVGGLGDIFGNVTNPTQLGRESLKMLPIPGGVGTGIQRELLPTRSQR